MGLLVTLEVLRMDESLAAFANILLVMVKPPMAPAIYVSNLAYYSY